MLSNWPYSIICWHFLSCVRNAQIAVQVKNKIKQTSLGHFDWVTSAVSIFSVSWCSDTAFTWHYEYQPPALLLRLNSNVSRTARDLHVIPGEFLNCCQNKAVGTSFFCSIAKSYKLLVLYCIGQGITCPALYAMEMQGFFKRYCKSTASRTTTLESRNNFFTVRIICSSSYSSSSDSHI